MRGSSDRKTKKEKKVEVDEVEQLLQATQDQILLNLTLNSHTTRSSPSLYSSNNNNDDDIHLDLDLERRFQALKRKSPAQDNNSKDDKDLNSVVLGDDLVARFSVLKGKSSSSSSQVPLGVGPTASNGGCGYEESEDEEDQVQKLIEWAKDAARLDPSPPSDDDDDDDDDNSSSASDDADNDDRRKQK